MTYKEKQKKKKTAQSSMLFLIIFNLFEKKIIYFFYFTRFFLPIISLFISSITNTFNVKVILVYINAEITFTYLIDFIIIFICIYKSIAIFKTDGSLHSHFVIY